MLSVRGDIVRGLTTCVDDLASRWTPMADWLPTGPTRRHRWHRARTGAEVAARTFRAAAVTDIRVVVRQHADVRSRHAARRRQPRSTSTRTRFPRYDLIVSQEDVGPWCLLLPGLDVTTMGWYDRG